MSSVFELNFDPSLSNWKVNKKSKEYKRLKGLFPDCDFIFNIEEHSSLMNDDDEYPSVLQFLAKGINQKGYFIFLEPLDDEVYELVNKLTKGEWYIEIYIIKTYDGEGTTWNASGKITNIGIDWNITQNKHKDASSEIDDEDGRTPLQISAEKGDTKTVKLLIDKGADIEAKDGGDGWTALMWAVSQGHTKTIELLLEKGADIEAKEKHNQNRTALMLAANTETIEMLLDKGANIEATDNDGNTALMLAASGYDAYHGNTETIEMLIDKGADIEAKNKFNKTALMIAAEERCPKAAEMLLDKGANIEASDDDGRTALIYAVHNRANNDDTETVALLIDKGADIKAKDKKGNSALSVAEQEKLTDIVKYLKKAILQQGSKNSPSKKNAEAQKKDNVLKKAKKV